MCGILAFSGDNTPTNRRIVHDVMAYLSLRGTHATGIAYHDLSWGVGIAVEPIGAEQFMVRHPIIELCPPEAVPVLGLIAHTRYSTSDIAWNLPLIREGRALVMNGVISQELPCDWPGADIMEYETGNDAEIALMYALSEMRGQLPGSFACCELADGEVLCYRNTDRPLWWGHGRDYTIVASTKDALLRSKVSNIKNLLPGRVYDVFPNGLVPRIREMDYRPVTLALGSSTPQPEVLFETDPIDQQSAELLYGDLSCLL